MALTASGIVAAVLGSASTDHGAGFWLAVGAFALLVGMAAMLYPMDTD
jgi:hypothetical protein